MKVLLQKDIPGTGKRGEVRDVANGFAANYLIPKKLAIIATLSVIADKKIQESAQGRKKAGERADIEKLARLLSEEPLTIKAKANEQGKLFGGVDAKIIARAASERLGTPVDQKLLHISSPIETLGVHPFEIIVSKTDTKQANIHVIAEE